MKKLTITKSTPDELIIDEDRAIDMLKTHGLLTFLKNFKVDDEFIMACEDILDETEIITVLASGIKISQNLVEFFIERELIKPEHIRNISMSIYSTLDKSFIEKYDEHINWEKMIVYLTSTDQLDLTKYLDIIESKDLWNIVSTTPLPIEFIREHKDKLKWNVVSILNDFTGEEVEEFEEYLLKANSIEIVDNTVHLDTKEIFETFKKNGLYNKKDSIDKPEDLTTEEIQKLKALLKIIK